MPGFYYLKSYKFMKIILIVLLVLLVNSCAFFNRQANIASQRERPFTVDMRSPKIPAGQIEVQVNNVFPVPGIRRINVNVVYYPFEDAVCLEYRYNTITYYQFWHRGGRELFVRTLERYNEDFISQNLRSGRNHRTKTQYGVIENCFLAWQAFSFSMLARGNMEIELGYYFRENAPFFAITQMPAYFESPTLKRDDDQVSPEIPMFFTRAQAEELAALFDQDFLRSLAPDIQPVFVPSDRGLPADFDEY